MLEDTYTIEEVAKHLRVPVETVDKEIASGRLPAIVVGGNIVRVGESDLIAYKRKVRVNVGSGEASGDGTTPNLASQLRPAPDFEHKWPHKKEEAAIVEHFTQAHEGPVPYGGSTYHVKLGFTLRKAAGRVRRRCVVFVDQYPTVEFVGADDTAGDGQLASVIKDRARKQLPAGTPLPPEYQGMPIGKYRDIVDGPNASNGAAVICNASDLATMVKHALIRYHYWEERT